MDSSNLYDDMVYIKQILNSAVVSKAVSVSFELDVLRVTTIIQGLWFKLFNGKHQELTQVLQNYPPELLGVGSSKCNTSVFFKLQEPS